MPVTERRAREASGLVLVVDDDEAIRAVFSAALRRAGFAVHTATDGRAALDHIAAEPVDVVLLDATLPGMTGLEILAEIRGALRRPTLPVLLVTGLDAVEDRVRGLEAGATDYVVKPVNLEELVARVRAQLRYGAAWGDVQTDLERRLDALQLLRSVGRFDAPADTARAVVRELVQLETVDGAAVLVVRGARAVGVLAGAGDLADWGDPGFAFDADTASTISTRLATGPWMQPAPTARLRAPEPGAIDLGRAAATAFAPVHGDHGPVAAVVLAQRTDGEPAGRLLSSAIDLSAVVGSLLAPELERAEALDGRRARLRSAVTRGMFVPHYQPIVDLADGTVVGFEGLTRWSDGVAPDVRFTEAVELGIGGDVERATLAALIRGAEPLDPDTWLSVNVSASVLAAGHVDDVVVDSPRALVLEVTEHEQIDDDGEVLAALGQLPGVRFAVDDAGAGYSSLQRVLALRPHLVKLDTVWARDIDRDLARQALVHGIARFAEAFGCTLVSEGIETASERDTLARLGVPLGQGYFFGRPAPIDALVAAPQIARSCPSQ